MKDSCLHITFSADCLSTAVYAATSYTTCVVCSMYDMLFRSECNRFESQLQPGTQHRT